VADAALRIPRQRWRHLFAELAARGRGERESGAFLLAEEGETAPKVRDVVYFDDLYPGALTGIVSLPGTAFGPLWQRCERLGMRVVADIHTHGGRSVAQSRTDATNPLVGSAGHIALIAPDFAQGRIRPADLGVHLYLGAHRWESAFSHDATQLVRRTWW